MPVTLGARPEHGFDQPLALLSDCHRRIEHFLGLLEKVVEQCAGMALPAEHRRAVEASLTYFDSAAPRHTQDEEHSLFPRLRELDRAEVKAALQRLAALEADHDVADVLHAEARFWFRRWLDEGPLDPPEVRRLKKILHRLRELYRRHIELEDREIFPLAGQVLEDHQLSQIGQEMARRRGLATG
jgi:hemerythrin-like domain-containing protein